MAAARILSHSIFVTETNNFRQIPLFSGTWQPETFLSLSFSFFILGRSGSLGWWKGGLGECSRQKCKKFNFFVGTLLLYFSAYVNAYVCVGVCLCMYVCVFVCMWVDMYVSIYCVMCAYPYVCVFKFIINISNQFPSNRYYILMLRSGCVPYSFHCFSFLMSLWKNASYGIHIFKQNFYIIIFL